MFHWAFIQCSIFPMNMTPTRGFGFKSTSNRSAAYGYRLKSIDIVAMKDITDFCF
jgi:hypothetical protein